MNTFLVTVKENLEYHFKVAVSAYDPQSKISKKDTKFLVESQKWDLLGIKSLTSVKTVVDQNLIESKASSLKSHPFLNYDVHSNSYTNFDPQKLTLENLSDMCKELHDKGIVYLSAEVYACYNTEMYQAELTSITCKRMIDFAVEGNRMLKRLVRVKCKLHPNSTNGWKNGYTLWCEPDLGATIPDVYFIQRVEKLSSHAILLYF